MELKKILKGKIVFLDTAPLIYFIEGHSKYQQTLLEIFTANDNEEFLFITSTITLLETLVQPLRLKRNDLAEKYETILRKSTGIEIFDIDSSAAKRAAYLRARHNMKTPDAIQLAVALENNASLFLTNDNSLKKVNDIRVIILDEI